MEEEWRREGEIEGREDEGERGEREGWRGRKIIEKVREIKREGGGHTLLMLLLLFS